MSIPTPTAAPSTASSAAPPATPQALVLDFGGVISRTLFETHEMCLDQLALPAAACVFVDDQPRNVEGGRRAGLRCVHFDVQRPAEGFGRALDLLGVARPQALVAQRHRRPGGLPVPRQ